MDLKERAVAREVKTGKGNPALELESQKY